MKDINDCIRFANDNKVCYLATTEKDQPRVRALGMWFADESGFYFQTGTMKSLYRQLKANPKTEACFYDQGSNLGMMLRISGEVEFLDDRHLKEKVMKDRPFLKDLGYSADSANMVIFRVAHGEAEVWTIENNMKPRQVVRF